MATRLTSCARCNSFIFFLQLKHIWLLHVTVGNVTWTIKCRMNGVPGCGDRAWALVMRLDFKFLCYHSSALYKTIQLGEDYCSICCRQLRIQLPFDSKFRATLYRITNSTSGKFCFVAFIVNSHSSGFHSQTTKLQRSCTA